MSQQNENASPEIGSVEDLVSYFREAETPRADFRIGTEHEKIGLHHDTLARVPYNGDRGIGALLASIQRHDAGWAGQYEGDHLIALAKEGASITLEPGGQLELSGAPLRTLRETCREFDAHVELLKLAGEQFSIDWIALGADPLHRTEDIPRMPKARYDIMRAYLPTRGGHALDMMHATATVQANYDYESEPDMVAKFRAALGCSPLGSALFANSPLALGKESGFATRRVDIWRDTDPDRCGLLPFVYAADFGYRRYTEWALDVPMFFVVREGVYHAMGRTTFRQFLQDGLTLNGEVCGATMADWDLHLTTLFPEVRLKRFLEVRGADAAPGPFICALPALWKGVLYDDESTRAAWALVADWSLARRTETLSAVARDGLRASVDGEPVVELARELLRIADAGLGRIAERGEVDADERSFLEPLWERVEAARSLSDEVLQAWHSSGGSHADWLAGVRY